MTNAHAELPNGNNYPYRVCCNASYDKIEVKINQVCNKKEGRFISLSSSTNAHVGDYEKANYQSSSGAD
ncbi:MAG: septal ring lytic transglycosylase RlpA family protein [Leptospiraceae bacterium]|nr:septal ring lytic transglycosylase RlpA family protein [Leptospiraceae bacterium]